MYISVWGHGCVFASERPSEWESQALLGLTAASWCCSRKSCWTCYCLLAASLCVCVCVSLHQCIRLGVGPLLLGHSCVTSQLPSHSSGLPLKFAKNNYTLPHQAMTHTCWTVEAVVWLCLIMLLKHWWTKQSTSGNLGGFFRLCSIIPSCRWNDDFIETVSFHLSPATAR